MVSPAGASLEDVDAAPSDKVSPPTWHRTDARWRARGTREAAREAFTASVRARTGARSAETGARAEAACVRAMSAAAIFFRARRASRAKVLAGYFFHRPARERRRGGDGALRERRGAKTPVGSLGANRRRGSWERARV
jgi:hypothetical protein